MTLKGISIPALGPAATAAAGQIPGTATNDNASAGNVGEYVVSSTPSTTGTVTITIASPAVVTWTGNTMLGYVPIRFTTTGALPTGITAGTQYYTSKVAGDTFNIATSFANAVAGTFINTSGTQSGVQTADGSQAMTTNVVMDVAAISLTAGDWDVWLSSEAFALITTVVTSTLISISQTSATLTFPFVRVTPYVGNGSTAVTLVSAPLRVSLAATTTLFGTTRAVFTTSTMATQAVTFRARRVR